MAANSGPSFFWDKFIPFFYSIGAAVVIVGALGKIMHYSWAGILLPVGLGTEALIFVIYALQTFLRPESSYQWEKVYPELSDDFKGELPTKSMHAAPAGLGLTAKMDDMMANAKITPDIFDGLKSSFQSLSSTVNNMGEIANATVATNEYSSKVREAAGKITEMNGSLGTAFSSLSTISDASKDAQEYRSQFQKIAQNMGALNAVYELELQDTNKHLKSMNSFYSNLSSAMQDMSDAKNDTQQFKSELGKLTTNIASLNNVYGSMLSAMKGGNA
jgi:gliding motility-associated protein GldL